MLESFTRNAAQTYEHKEFGNVRVVEADGAVEFCGKDVAIALGYTNASDALKRHCKGVVKRYPPSYTRRNARRTLHQRTRPL